MSSGYARLPLQGKGSGTTSTPKFVKQSLKIQLDAPSTPVILPGASHTYSIDLGAEYEQMAICNFQWVQPGLNAETPDVVLGSASFPGDKFGGVLIVNKTPGGWVRGFEKDEPEYQNGNPTSVDAPFFASSGDVSAPMGYGSQPLEVPLDHIVLQTNPPKKLQIEDAYLEGNSLKITIKNADSVALDLSSYVGVTALFDENRPAQMSAVSETGVIVYTHSDIPPTSTNLRVSEDSGKSFKNISIQEAVPSLAAISASSNSVNTFIGMINYEYVRTAQGPNYAIQRKFPIRTTFGDQLSFSLGGNLTQVPNHGDKVFDWKKTDTESTALFSAFLNYNDIVLYKSVDDCASFGANNPTFNDALSLWKASEDLDDFYRASVAEGNSNSNSLFHGLVKAQVKVIDSDTHFLNLTYFSKPEPLKNGREMSPVWIGAQNITGNDGIVYGIRDDEVVFDFQNFQGNSALGTILIENSTLGNNGLRNTTGGTVLGFLKPLYVGSGTWGEGPTVSLNGNQTIVKKSDWDTISEPVLIGDQFTINGVSTFQPMLFAIEDAQITVGGNLTDVKVLTFRNTFPNQGFHSDLNPPLPSTDGGGDVIPFVDILPMKTGRWAAINNQYYSIWRSTPVGESPATFTTEDDPNVKITFIASMNTIKQKLLKTTDGGTTWNSIIEHPEFRYGVASVFNASNDGQTLLLASMRYGQGVGYENWSYPLVFGNEARFNMSTDGGITWKNPSGSWDKISDGLTRVQYLGANNPSYIKRTTGQVAANIDSSILMILYYGAHEQLPYLFRSTDNGTTWQSGVRLTEQTNERSFLSYSNDSKDQFMAFAGSIYLSNQYQYVFYGALVDKFTQWPTYGILK